MKFRLLPSLSLLLLALCSCKKDEIATQSSPTLFNDTALPQLSLSLRHSEWQKLLDLYDADSGTKEYVRCNIEFRSKRLLKIEDAGLRLRGQTSRRRPQTVDGRFRHFHAGLHTRKFVESNTDIDGFRRINLKYAKDDPTYIREHYCYDLLSRYGVWTAPESSWCRLSIDNGQQKVYYGVYLMVESIDRQYLKRRPEFGSPDGFLWKCSIGADLSGTSGNLFHLDDNSSGNYAYELKDDDPVAFEAAKKQLRGFISKFNSLKGDEFRQWVQEAVDVPLLLKMYAANVAVGHWDDYWNNTNNFYIYFNSRDPEKYRFYMLPYDYDNTLGTSNNCGVQSDSGRHDPYNWGMKRCTLISKLLSIKEFRDMYTDYLHQLSLDGLDLFNFAASTTRIQKWQKLLEPYIPNDTREDNVLQDRPASWGNHPEYRVMEDGKNNWFRVKCEVLRKAR